MGLVDYDDQTTEISDRIEKQLDFPVKKYSHVVAVSMLLFIMASIFAVVWQAGMNRSLEMQKQRLQAEIVDLEEQHRIYRATIAKESMPESLVRHAIDDDLSFMQIPPSSLLLLSKEP